MIRYGRPGDFHILDVKVRCGTQGDFHTLHEIRHHGRLHGRCILDEIHRRCKRYGLSTLDVIHLHGTQGGFHILGEFRHHDKPDGFRSAGDRLVQDGKPVCSRKPVALLHHDKFGDLRKLVGAIHYGTLVLGDSSVVQLRFCRLGDFRRLVDLELVCKHGCLRKFALPAPCGRPECFGKLEHFYIRIAVHLCSKFQCLDKVLAHHKVHFGVW